MATKAEARATAKDLSKLMGEDIYVCLTLDNAGYRALTHSEYKSLVGQPGGVLRRGRARRRVEPALQSRLDL